MNALEQQRILHVDDDAGVRASLSLLLTAEGYSLSSAATGREAVQQVREGFDPDVLIVDSQIDDDMDGAEVAEQLRIALGYSPPVIMLTGNPARAELPLDHRCAGVAGRQAGEPAVAVDRTAPPGAPVTRDARCAGAKKNPRSAWVVRLMVRLERFELPAFWFVARRSIQLSYSRMKGRAF